MPRILTNIIILIALSGLSATSWARGDGSLPLGRGDGSLPLRANGHAVALSTDTQEETVTSVIISTLAEEIDENLICQNDVVATVAKGTIHIDTTEFAILGLCYAGESGEITIFAQRLSVAGIEKAKITGALQLNESNIRTIKGRLTINLASDTEDTAAKRFLISATESSVLAELETVTLAD